MLRAAPDLAAGDDDPAVGEGQLLADLLVVPARGVELGQTYLRQVSASVAITSLGAVEGDRLLSGC